MIGDTLTVAAAFGILLVPGALLLTISALQDRYPGFAIYLDRLFPVVESSPQPYPVPAETESPVSVVMVGRQAPSPAARHNLKVLS
jgi:hypothetical protein